MHAFFGQQGSDLRKRSSGLFFIALLLGNHGVQVAANVNAANGTHANATASKKAEDVSVQTLQSWGTVMDSKLFAEPEAVVTQLAEITGEPRQLQATIAPPKEITNEFDYTRTSFTFYFINDIESPLTCQPGDCNPALGIYAGVNISQVEILVDPDIFNAPSAKFRVVRDNVDKAGAQAGMCKYGDYTNSAHSAVVSRPWAEYGSFTSAYDGSMICGNPAESTPLLFKMGGIFKLCYSDDGSFEAGHADVVPYGIKVNGIFDNDPACAEVDTCLTKRPYRCFLLRQAYNNMADAYDAPTTCVLDYSGDNQGYVGLPGKGSWTGMFAVTYDDDGVVDTFAERTCGSPSAKDYPADFLCNTDGACGTAADARYPYVTPNASVDNKRLHYPVGRNDLLDPGVFKAYSVAACYCPDFQKCDSFNPDYVQQVGILHFYVSKVCPNGYQATVCTKEYTGSAPQHRFAMRLQCPSNACANAHFNRIKIVEQKAINDLPAWDSSSGCGTATHGINRLGVKVLPDYDNPNVAKLHGGIRQDYKLWNFKNTSTGLNYDASVSGFMFMMGTTDHELRSRYSGETFDVCYCDGTCATPGNWFKVGQLRFAPLQLVSAASNTSTAQNEFIIEYMNTPGTFGFYRPWVDYGVMGLEEGGSLKLAADPGVNFTDTDCLNAKYDRDLVDETGSGFRQTNAHTSYKGKLNAQVDVNKLVFNNAELENQITVLKAGFLAVCYCASPTADQPGKCDYDKWVLANRITIRGPGLGQSWKFSTHVVFRIEYEGWGLAKDDKIRIIPSTSSCSDLSGNPRAAWGVTNIKVGCPHPCSEVGEINDVLNGDISVSVLADDAYQCNDQNADCRTNDIKAVKVLDDKTTELEFEANPGLENGDLITIRENMGCSAGSTETVCNEERLAVLRGRYNMADISDNHNSAPNEYISGHIVTKDPENTKKVTIPIGWPDPKPQFAILYSNAKRGGWTRHSKAITRQEIMGEKERMDMKICWKYTPAMGDAGPPPQHVAEVGTLTLIDPNPMSDCIISLTTLVKKQTTPFAPFILSFRTATAETGKKYQSVEGRTQLRIFFVRTVALYATFADGASIESNQGEDEIGEAKQYVCGKLFKELWSSDTDLGFPMPRGCYYRTYGQTQELNLLFDRKNGLAAGQNYQVVLSGVAMDEAVRDGEYAHIFTTDDADTKPYEAIERGIAKLYRSPQDPAYGSQGVRFFDPDGVAVSTGSGTEMYELEGGKELRMTLKGDPLGGGIKPSAILRIYLWPLTQWDVANACTVYCIPYDQVTAPCGAVQDCKGDAIIPNFQQNYLRVVLPSAMATMTEYVTHTFVFTDLVLPRGGFFSTRFGAQITKSDDTKPHYIEGTGDYLYKKPEEGIGVGKLVEFYGDGDQSPFRGDKLNVLYASIVVAATLFAAVQTGDAYMTLTLPEGYECVRRPDIDGDSPWRAEDTLGVFGSTIPQGTGSPDEGGGTRGWSVSANTCVYSLRQNAVVYAGSSLFVRVTVNNPTNAMKRMDPRNRWQVNLTSKGYHQYSVTYPSVVFKTTVQNFSANTAVLGKLTHYRIIPINWMYSANDLSISAGYIRVFFQTEQGTGVQASVHIQAPSDFSFTPCEVRDLDDLYYATPGQSGSPTKRLPGFVMCEHRTYPYNHAAIKLTGALLTKSYYAFQVMCVNAKAYMDEHRTGWRIFTLDTHDYRVDGTPSTTATVAHAAPSLPMSSDSTELSFGLYTAQLNTPAVTNVQVSVSDLMPYSASGQRAKVKVQPFKTLDTVRTTLRVVAPMGYIWDFQAAEFKHLAAFAGTDPNLIYYGVTGNLPGGFPKMQGNVLLWDEAQDYRNNETYGFEAYVRVPDRTPTASPNEFLFEMGYEGTSLATRYGASAVLCPEVRSLTNAAIEYVTNVESKETEISFQIQIITEVPVGGALLIDGPNGFIFPTACEPKVAPAARGSTYQVEPTADKVKSLPDIVTCSFNVPPGGGASLRLEAATGVIEPGLYRFQIKAKNPTSVMANPVDGSTPCNYTHCWNFRSVQDLVTEANLDMPISVPSFAVNAKIVEALIPALTLEQQAATLRDDRPLSRNPLVFAFKLQNTALYAADMLIRGPLGTVFREDCAQDVEVRPTEVFGTGQPLPAEYAEWPQEVEIVSCRGEGPDARIYIDPGISDGLQKEVLYPIRLATLHNPLSEPEFNRWTLDFFGESSDPFPGFSLWTFVRTSLHTASLGMSTTVTGGDYLQNPVTLTFRPKNTVRGEGMIIQVHAPQFWSIATEETGECRIMMQPITADASGFGNADPDVAPDPNYIGPPSLIWGDADVRCEVDDTGRMLTATVLAESREITGNRDYQLTIFVRNPQLIVAPPEEATWNTWKLDTYDSPGNSGVLPTFRDSVTMLGYPVYNKANEFLLENRDPVLGIPNYNGLAMVPSLYFQFELSTGIVKGDILVIQAPAGYHFQEDPNDPTACGGFRWEPKQDAYLYLPNSRITCTQDQMRFEVDEPKNIAEETTMKFYVDQKNPAKTPHIMLDHWMLTHYLGETMEILTQEAVKSWDIVPQLANVQVMLVGDRKAESSESTIAISFTPVSDADELTLSARRPTGFIFSGAATISLGHEVIETQAETIRVRAAMYSGVPVDIVITDFRLGLVGGATEFDLITKLNNGEQMDEMLNFLDGFRLPGRVSVSQPRIKSMFMLQPELYPVPSLWDVRMGEDAQVEVPFQVTVTASVGTMIRLRAPPYLLKAEGFTIISSGTAETISSEVISASSGELVASLSMAIFANLMYEVKVNCLTPKVPNPGDAMWTVEFLDGGALPLNTNDGVTEGFRLVDKVDLFVRSSRAPPLAIIDTELVIDPKSITPNELILVAPPGFNFTEDCLVNNGEYGEVKSCSYYGSVAGRASAILKTQRLTGVLQYVTISVMTPSQNPELTSWFVDAKDASTGLQLGWGEDPEGVTVRQMQGAGVVYPGIPSISGQMAFRFITNEKLEAGGILRVGYPKSIQIECTGESLYKVALEGEVTCQNFIKEGYFQLRLGRPMPPGQQSFAVRSTVPSSVPDNSFYIIVMSNTEEVRDAAMSVQGRRVQHGLSLSAMELIWGTAEPKRNTYVSMGLELTAELPLKDPPIMSEIIIQVPADFTQKVEKSAHVEVLTRPLPQRSGGWLDVSNPQRLRLLLDEQRVQELEVDQYRFQFPIVVPSVMPKYNVWEMTICGPSLVPNATCTGKDDPRAMVTFPLAGFAMGESHPQSIQYSTTGGATPLKAFTVWQVPLLWLLWAVLRQ